MSRPLLALLLAAAPFQVSSHASAQSSLGLNMAEASLTVTERSGSSRLEGRVAGDYRLSAAHGLQFGLTAYSLPEGWIGQVDAHLYLRPQTDRKYGFYLSLADIDDRSGTIATGGIEALWSPHAGTVLEAKAGAGLATGSRDFLTVSGTVTQAVSDRLAVFAHIDLTALDEADISAVAVSGTTGATYAIAGTGIELMAALATDRLVGRDSRDVESQAKIGVTWRFGAERGARRTIDSRDFETVRPLDAMLLRGLF